MGKDAAARAGAGTRTGGGRTGIPECAADLVIAVTPFEEPDAGLAAAVCGTGSLGVLDLGSGGPAAFGELAALRGWAPGRFGVRVGPRCRARPGDVLGRGPAPHTVVLDPAADGWDPAEVAAGHRLLVEVTDLEQALAAVDAGAHGLIARGCEGPGRVGELSTFVLLQQLLADHRVTVPVWAQGGIGPYTAAAAVAGGAAGVVLDSQLALTAESSVPDAVAAALRGMDGSQTAVADGRRVLRRGPGGPSGAVLPVGEDGFLADRFAGRWRTAGRAVHAVRDAVLDALRLAGERGAALLGPDAPLAAALGSRLPVAQGPMTRVSDQPRFAAAVAAAGALPFVALALSGQEQTRELLTRTAAEAGDRPWGVGVLGFAPEAVRGAQLAEVLAARPSHALIAGGRPSQARTLEEAGIRTFLHVPSPGLLRQFLQEGARRFVFEGAECGGHIGPRHSFPLWEAQLAELEDFLGRSRSTPRVEVLFAGGVHDERSAAMVAALAAPLAARGLDAGVLMGTAYLFTEEAVACEAVRPQFQRQVLAARGTALLQTAPGHTTRCLPSPYTAEFGRERDRLRAAGLPDREVWERLEQLNLGRLRIASKGVDRVAGGISPVGEDEQVRRGMYMAGQVAVLRSATTTLAELHTAVGTRAARFLTARAAALLERLAAPRGAAPPRPLDVAVIGMACMFPKAPDLAAFWANVVAGVDAVTEVPAERWDPELYYSPDGAPGRTASKWGGFLPRIPFDPLRYGIPPTALKSIEPVQLLALETAGRALADAGYDNGVADGGRPFDRSRTAVVFGAEAGSDLSNAGIFRALLPTYLGGVPEPIASRLPELTEDSFPGMLANVIAGRVANRLDLGGANFTVDAACASSLAALDAACGQLRSGSADLALCGAADLHNGINDYLLFTSAHALSPTGRSRPFDAAADGIALGEGVACLVLKRLADAERDGDQVYAVVKGIGAASDGRSLGLTAPRPEGQRAAMERAWRTAGLSPADAGLLEAHGTGTVVGDRTELTVLQDVFEAAGARPGSCTLGSVKSQIGHTKCAAGLAGLIKAVLALHHGVKPPTLHVRNPNAAWRADGGAFVFHDRVRPWPAAAGERVAAVSAFGFGGTNFHVVLQGHGDRPPVHGLTRWPAELFTFRGADPQQALKAVAELLRLAESAAGQVRLRDLALAAARRADLSVGPVLIAVVASDPAQLTGLLRRALAGEHDPAAGLHRSVPDQAAARELAQGQVAFLFPGQGSQHLGMFAELLAAFPALQRHLPADNGWAELVYPPAAFSAPAAARQRAALTDTRAAQPALGMAGLTAVRLLAMAGVRPQLAAGHSYGELVALCAAGAVAEDALAALSTARAQAILDAVGTGGDPGAMAAVAAAAEDVERVLAAGGLAERVVAANRNAPRQTAVSGPTDDVAAAVRLLREAGFDATPLPVACAFHSPLVAGAGERFAETLAAHQVRSCRVPVWSNRTAERYPTEPGAIRAELAAQIGAPVRFAAQIEAMYQAGARVFVEAGPGAVLTRLVRQILGDRPYLAVPVQGARPGLAGFLDALAQLAVAGVPVQTGRLLRGRDAVDAGRAQAARRAGWTVDGQSVRTADGDPLPGAPAPARPVPEASMAMRQPHFDGDPSEQDALVAEFLKSSREMIAAQRDVLLTYFGREGKAAQPVPASPGPVAAPSVEAPAPVAPREADQRPAESAESAGSQAGNAPLDEAGMLRAVVEVIAERTGYPGDMIDPDLDLEADLSIDSIKRTEIVGDLARRLSAGGGTEHAALPDEELETLAQARTAAAIAAWLTDRIGASSGPSSAPAASDERVRPAGGTEHGGLPKRQGGEAEGTAPDTGEGGAPEAGSGGAAPEADRGTAAEAGSAARPDAAAAEAGVGTAAAEAGIGTAAAAGPPEPAAGHEPTRLVWRTVPLPPPAAASGTLAGRRFALLGDGGPGIARAVADRLAACGAEAVASTAPDAVPGDGAGGGPVDGVLLLDPLRPDGPPVLPGLVPVLQAVLARAPRRLLAARRPPDLGTDAAGRALGMRGLCRTLAREYPEMPVRLVETGEPDPEGVAAALVEELLAGGDEPVVVRGRDGRRAPALVECDLGVLGRTGAGPAGEGAAEAAALGLDKDSVVLLVGGARGIAARCAAAFASAAGCRLELLGRSAAPEGPEDPATAAAGDLAALRGVLARQGVPLPDVEATARRLLAGREIAATLGELSALGSTARYRRADATDAGALRRAVEDIHAEYGRLDGVVYAAGVVEDKVFAEKDPRSFERVYATKADGARALLDSLAELPTGPRFTVLFGSVSAVLGNRGQADYAAGNDAMEELADRWARRGGRRALTVHWGPWAPVGAHRGMVSPALAREYARRGVRLVDPAAGAAALLRELAWGDPAVRSVVYTAGRW